jgi:hypothetical protein
MDWIITIATVLPTLILGCWELFGLSKGERRDCL